LKTIFKKELPHDPISEATYLSSLAGILLSPSYLPGFSPWFDNLDPNLKRLFVLPLILAVAIGSYGVACAGRGDLVDPLVTCNTSGAISLFRDQTVLSSPVTFQQWIESRIL
jgi:hypothetical protein